MTNNLMVVMQEEMGLWLQIVTPIVRTALVPQQQSFQISSEPTGLFFFFFLGSRPRKCGFTWSGLVILKTIIRGLCHQAGDFLHLITGKAVLMSIGPQNGDIKVTAKSTDP